MEDRRADDRAHRAAPGGRERAPALQARAAISVATRPPQPGTVMVPIRRSPVTAGTRCYTPPTRSEALRRGAYADGRSLSSMTLRIIREWLDDHRPSWETAPGRRPS